MLYNHLVNGWRISDEPISNPVKIWDDLQPHGAIERFFTQLILSSRSFLPDRDVEKMVETFSEFRDCEAVQESAKFWEFFYKNRGKQILMDQRADDIVNVPAPTFCTGNNVEQSLRAVLNGENYNFGSAGKNYPLVSSVPPRFTPEQRSAFACFTEILISANPKRAFHRMDTFFKFGKERMWCKAVGGVSSDVLDLPLPPFKNELSFEAAQLLSEAYWLFLKTLRSAFNHSVHNGSIEQLNNDYRCFFEQRDNITPNSLLALFLLSELYNPEWAVSMWQVEDGVKLEERLNNLMLGLI